MKKNFWQSVAGVLIGGLFLYFTLDNKPISEIIESISKANIYWVIANGIALFLVFYLRAIRWKVLLENIDYKPKERNVVYSVTLAYFVNSFTPKFGELSRCTSLNKSDNIPVSKSLGTVVSERIWDILVLFVGLFILFIIEIKRLGGIFSGLIENITSLFTNHLYLAIIIILAFLGGTYIFWVFFKKSKLLEKVQHFLKDILQTVRMTFKLKKGRYFLFLTLAVWLTLTFMNYFCIKALPETEDFNLYFAAVVLFIGGIGWAIPSPGGIGTTHFIILQLFIAFQLSPDAGIAYGVLSNGLTFVFTLIFGSVAMLIKYLNPIFAKNGLV